jgi:hypothetical protein
MDGSVASEIARRFAGAWRYVGLMVDGKPGTERGAEPNGIIIYDPSGHMAVHVAFDKQHMTTAVGRAPAEIDKLVPGHVAYFGKYSIDERAQTVTHHKQASVQPGDGGDVVRAYEFSGDRLILRPLEASTTEIIWERIK